MADTSYRVSREGDDWTLKIPSGRYRVQGLEGAILPEVWSIDGVGSRAPGPRLFDPSGRAVHEGWREPGGIDPDLKPVAINGTIHDLSGKRFFQPSRIEWEGKRYSWVACRMLELVGLA